MSLHSDSASTVSDDEFSDRANDLRRSSFHRLRTFPELGRRLLKLETGPAICLMTKSTMIVADTENFRIPIFIRQKG
ncbi:hypothetical protein U1Q18_036669, partial [Sarracenia purpurea var. burkii]